jgi:hypothetical protein
VASRIDIHCDDDEEAIHRAVEQRRAILMRHNPKLAAPAEMR